MENNIIIFNNEEFGQIRTVTINSEPWFVGKDIAKILGYADASSAVSKTVDNEDKTTLLLEQSGSNYKSKTTVINESGLYSLILSSKLPNAKKFKHWVTSEVLPSIRKHGAYMTNEIIERTLTDPDYLIQLATALKEERQARQLAEQKVEEQKPLVDFANQVSDSTNLIDMKTMAKLLKDENIDIGRNRLFDFLRMKKILMKDNIPYQRYINSGYFKVVEHTYTDSLGQIKTSRQTLVTGKGQLYISKIVKDFWNI